MVALAGKTWLSLAPKTMLFYSMENMFNFFMFRSSISKMELFFKKKTIMNI